MWKEAENWIINADNLKFIEPFTIYEYEEELHVLSVEDLDLELNGHAKLNKDMS